MDNTEFVSKIESFFDVDKYDNIVELETWTDGGVNMVIILYIDKEQSLYDQFKEYINSFDVDDEVELNRQAKEYRRDFTTRESIRDFDNYYKWLKEEVLVNL